MAADSVTPIGEFYAPKPVAPQLAPLAAACISGDLETVKLLWKPHMLDAVRRLGRDDTGQPLLHAAHHLRVEVVDFLLQQGMSPRQRGTVHPYTGDCMTVAETQGINSLELIGKMLFSHPRKSKRRDAMLALLEMLRVADMKQQAAMDSLQRQLSSSGGGGGGIAGSGLGGAGGSVSGSGTGMSPRSASPIPVPGLAQPPTVVTFAGNPAAGTSGFTVCLSPVEVVPATAGGGAAAAVLVSAAPAMPVAPPTPSPADWRSASDHFATPIGSGRLGSPGPAAVRALSDGGFHAAAGSGAAAAAGGGGATPSGMAAAAASTVGPDGMPLDASSSGAAVLGAWGYDTGSTTTGTGNMRATRSMYAAAYQADDAPGPSSGLRTASAAGGADEEAGAGSGAAATGMPRKKARTTAAASAGASSAASDATTAGKRSTATSAAAAAAAAAGVSGIGSARSAGEQQEQQRRKAAAAAAGTSAAVVPNPFASGPWVPDEPVNDGLYDLDDSDDDEEEGEDAAPDAPLPALPTTLSEALAVPPVEDVNAAVAASSSPAAGHLLLRCQLERAVAADAVANLHERMTAAVQASANAMAAADPVAWSTTEALAITFVGCGSAIASSGSGLLAQQLARVPGALATIATTKTLPPSNTTTADALVALPPAPPSLLAFPSSVASDVSVSGTAAATTTTTIHQSRKRRAVATQAFPDMLALVNAASAAPVPNARTPATGTTGNSPPAAKTAVATSTTTGKPSAPDWVQQPSSYAYGYGKGVGLSLLSMMAFGATPLTPSANNFVIAAAAGGGAGGRVTPAAARKAAAAAAASSGSDATIIGSGFSSHLFPHSASPWLQKLDQKMARSASASGGLDDTTMIAGSASAAAAAIKAAAAPRSIAGKRAGASSSNSTIVSASFARAANPSIALGISPHLALAYPDIAADAQYTALSSALEAAAPSLPAGSAHASDVDTSSGGGTPDASVSPVDMSVVSASGSTGGDADVLLATPAPPGGVPASLSSPPPRAPTSFFTPPPVNHHQAADAATPASALAFQTPATVSDASFSASPASVTMLAAAEASSGVTKTTTLTVAPVPGKAPKPLHSSVAFSHAAPVACTVLALPLSTMINAPDAFAGPASRALQSTAAAAMPGASATALRLTAAQARDAFGTVSERVAQVAFLPVVSAVLCVVGSLVLCPQSSTVIVIGSTAPFNMSRARLAAGTTSTNSSAVNDSTASVSGVKRPRADAEPLPDADDDSSPSPLATASSSSASAEGVAVAAAARAVWAAGLEARLRLAAGTDTSASSPSGPRHITDARGSRFMVDSVSVDFPSQSAATRSLVGTIATGHGLAPPRDLFVATVTLRAP